ncbi:MAG: DUF1343 domain-containing protein [Saprospiraceae bacterium]|nr:DUF1343 domain-containing protein [Saprospiraceae bacterium]
MKIQTFVVILLFFSNGCNNNLQPTGNEPIQSPDGQYVIQSPVLVGASRFGEYLPLIQGKTIALVVNHTSLVNNTHLVDMLKGAGIQIKTIFAPEHGFRGTASDGEKIEDGKDSSTGIQVISLYGSKRAPSAQDLSGVEWVLFDIQDVGTRFYTYISTMTYVMQACAENKVKMMVLDRPNPNGHFVDGPILEPEFKSFVGLHPVPVVYGMTIGEYAQMVNGEGWLEGGVKCDLKIIGCNYYEHKTSYDLPVKPSPNLPNMLAIYLYPSLCFFEGTNVSIGRGTNKQFQVIGSPDYPKGDFTFTPQPMEGAMQPPLEGKLCNGYDLSTLKPEDIHKEARINLSYLLNFYKNFPDKESFFLKTNYIDKLAGTKKLRDQIIAGKSEEEIRATWQEGLGNFMKIRKKYLLYRDF